MNDDYIYFTVTDPQNRSIRLYNDTWDHITSGHPEIKKVSEIQSIIQKPHVITEVTEEKLAYTKISSLNLYVNVYVKVDSTQQKGKIKTAFIQSKMPKGDVIWTATK